LLLKESLGGIPAASESGTPGPRAAFDTDVETGQDVVVKPQRLGFPLMKRRPASGAKGALTRQGKIRTCLRIRNPRLKSANVFALLPPLARQVDNMRPTEAALLGRESDGMV
jgi:hypothetical protein